MISKFFSAKICAAARPLNSGVVILANDSFVIMFELNEIGVR